MDVKFKLYPTIENIQLLINEFNFSINNKGFLINLCLYGYYDIILHYYQIGYINRDTIFNAEDRNLHNLNVYEAILYGYLNRYTNVSLEKIKIVFDKLLNLNIPVEHLNNNNSILLNLCNMSHTRDYTYEKKYNDKIIIIDYLISIGADVDKAIQVNTRDIFPIRSEYIDYLKNIERVETKAVEN